MIQLSLLMLWLAIFFGILGFLRGWNKELIATAGIVLALFAIFQFDGFFRGTLFLTLPPTQVFFIQFTIFFAVVAFVYQARDLAGTQNRNEDDWQSGFLGVLIGALNGYLIGGSLWYFLDINEYPIEQFVVAPGANSASAQSLHLMPILLLGGGASGTGDLMAFGVLILLFIVLVVI